MTQLQWFRFFAPEFAALSDAQVTALLAAAAVFVSTSGLNTDQANAALALYAAHLQWATVNRASVGSSAGNVISEKEGDLSRSYGSMQGDDTWLGQSPYGLQFIEVMRPAVGGCIMTRYGMGVPSGACY